MTLLINYHFEINICQKNQKKKKIIFLTHFPVSVKGILKNISVSKCSCKNNNSKKKTRIVSG